MHITFQSVDENGQVPKDNPPPRAGARAPFTDKIQDCKDLKGEKENFFNKFMPEDNKCRRGRDVLSCYSYMDKNLYIQKKCTCGPSNTMIGLPNFVINGCGPKTMGATDTSANQFLHKDTIKCCNHHDICMGRLVDSGPCARRFTTCLKKVQDYTMLGMFRRNMMDWMVRTGSYFFIKKADNYNCYRIDKPKLKTLQLKHQQELFNMLRE